VTQQQRVWHKTGLAPTAVSVNLSGLHFRQQHIASHIKSLVYEEGGNPQDIELELTESALVTDASTTIATLKELKDAGFRLAIDDFGTGYSSLAYLQRFPIDTLKIDQAFVKDLKLGKADSPIMRAIIGMGRALNLHIVAEGVETRDQLAFLRMQGCAAYQGYLFSKPVPAPRPSASEIAWPAKKWCRYWRGFDPLPMDDQALQSQMVWFPPERDYPPELSREQALLFRQ
jgi:EAL domain-containing protein (putative c-di-GMP-specific phosphodiesterase class I)